jgi:hypothetical protein
MARREGAACKRCSACKACWFCGPTCLVAGWKEGHREACRLLAAARRQERGFGEE